MTATLLPLRSVSQVNQYTRCPQSYKLARIDKVWQRPAAWLPQGSAVHTVLEHVEIRNHEGDPMTLEEAQELFRDEYPKEIEKYTDGPDEERRTPNFDYWTWSGPYNGIRDIERRYDLGLEQIEKFFAWKRDTGQKVWVTPDGKLAAELYFEIELPFSPELVPITGSYEADGLTVEITVDGIMVRGYIDAVVELADGSLRVRDYKTGAKPGDDFQLSVYALVIKMLYGIDVTTGDYYMAGKKGIKGKTTLPYDLTEWTQERITERFHEVERGIQAEEFDPLPETDKCNFCDVSRSCVIFNS